MRLRLLIAYDGSRYSGWQVQCPSKAPFTIQGCLEKAIGELANQQVRVIGSGRTDAGVHALGQVAHVELSDARPVHVDNWRHSLNCILPEDIRILDACPVSSSFHAGKNVLSKTYAYVFWQEKNFYPPLLYRQIWPCGPLDYKAMTSALPYLTGEHDFAAFQNAGTPLRSTIRTIFNISLREEALMNFLPLHEPVIRLQVTASGFLKQMVRNIAGLLCYIGQGRIEVKEIPALLAARDRQLLRSPTAPAAGLSLLNVKYATEE